MSCLEIVVHLRHHRMAENSIVLFSGQIPMPLQRRGHHQKNENAPKLALTLALSRRERGTVGMREGNTYAHARTM